MSEEPQILQVRLLNCEAVLPKRANLGSAGYDIASCEDKTLAPKQRALISTGLAIGFPNGCYGRLAPRSGLAWHHGVDICAGVIDPDYTGEVLCLVANNSDLTYSIRKGDRICQLICEKFAAPEVKEIASFEQTDRGDQGFGSTGK